MAVTILHQAVDTCNDAMDLECVGRCVNSGFNAETCRGCEATRPIVVINMVPSENIEGSLEAIANNTFPSMYHVREIYVLIHQY